ncbi:MAG: DUF4249 domain-containing protein [Prevotella sp.]|nr:DUF4249 domain-containing protein [Prevotella sp.]
MRNLHKLLVFVTFAVLAACTEDIVIDVQEGEPLIGVEASFTDEWKQHEAILSYSASFYNQDEIIMISGATVYVTDGVDTVYYREDMEHLGHYFTDLAAGKKNTVYRLCIEVPESDGTKHFLFAESLMPNNVESIDSLVVKPFNGENDTMPTTFFMDTIEWIYPYFQSLPDPSIIYMPSISINDSLVSNAFTQRMVIPVAGYAGYYINGPEMQAANKEIPIGYFRKSDLNDGDSIRADLYSITSDYLYYVYSLIASSGSNPMLGAPANVSSNIQPEGEGVGWFFTASSVSTETVFRK